VDVYLIRHLIAGHADETRWPDDAARPVTVLSGRTERTVALVGHEPHLPSLASLLCTGSEGALRLRLKKGESCCSGSTARSLRRGATLRWAVTPKILRALGGE
jgi:phosphohistidine phosphatase SixA